MCAYVQSGYHMSDPATYTNNRKMALKLTCVCIYIHTEPNTYNIINNLRTQKNAAKYIGLNSKMPPPPKQCFQLDYPLPPPSSSYSCIAGHNVTGQYSTHKSFVQYTM